MQCKVKNIIINLNNIFCPAKAQFRLPVSIARTFCLMLYASGAPLCNLPVVFSQRKHLYFH